MLADLTDGHRLIHPRRQRIQQLTEPQVLQLIPNCAQTNPSQEVIHLAQHLRYVNLSWIDWQILESNLRRADWILDQPTRSLAMQEHTTKGDQCQPNMGYGLLGGTQI